jgi:hypothetical protein
VRVADIRYRAGIGQPLPRGTRRFPSIVKVRLMPEYIVLGSPLVAPRLYVRPSSRTLRIIIVPCAIQAVQGNYQLAPHRTKFVAEGDSVDSILGQCRPRTNALLARRKGSGRAYFRVPLRPTRQTSFASGNVEIDDSWIIPLE